MHRGCSHHKVIIHNQCNKKSSPHIGIMRFLSRHSALGKYLHARRVEKGKARILALDFLFCECLWWRIWRDAGRTEGKNISVYVRAAENKGHEVVCLATRDALMEKLLFLHFLVRIPHTRYKIFAHRSQPSVVCNTNISMIPVINVVYLFASEQCHF